MSRQAQLAQVQAARKEAGLWLDLEEIARFVCMETKDQCRGHLVYFSNTQWADVLTRGKKAAAKGSVDRRFDRWKKEVRSIHKGVLLRGDPQIAMDLGIKSDALYAVDARVVSERVLPALERAERLAEAYEQAYGKRVEARVPRKKFVRDQSAAQVAVALGVSPDLIKRLIKQGLPRDDVRKPGAKRGAYRFNADEVREWRIAQRAREGLRSSHERVPATAEMRARLAEIRDYLGLTIPRMAELLEVSQIALKQYMGTSGTPAKTIPKSIVDGAEALMDLQRSTSVKNTRVQRITCEEVRAALEASHGFVARAARLLKVGRATALALVQECGIADQSPRSMATLRVSREDVIKAMEKHDNVVRRAARELNLSSGGLTAAIQRYRLQFATRKPRKVQREQLEEAIRRGELAHVTAERLGVSGKGVRDAYKTFGLKVPISRRPPTKRGSTSEGGMPRKNPWLPQRGGADPLLPAPLERVAPATMTAPPRGLDFMSLARGDSPTIYLTEGARPRPEISRAMQVLATADPREGITNPDAWEDLLAAAGSAANVFVVDRHGERWTVLDVLWDPGGETGRLRLIHLGRRARQGPLLVDLEEAFGYMIPVVVYQSPYKYTGRPE